MLFQFLQGLIKTHLNTLTPYVDDKFQFLQGLIKTLIIPFNTYSLSSFQFLQGLIKTCRSRCSKQEGRCVSIPTRSD